MSEFSNAAAAPASDPIRHDEPASSECHQARAQPEQDGGLRPPLQEEAGEDTAPKKAEPVDPWKIVRKLALKQLDRFVSLEPEVLRGDDPDAIHDLRVASRRLQQVLDLIYPQPRPGEIRRLRRKIRRCRRTLGEVRNCDVLLARVERTLAAKRTARREIWEAVSHYLHQRRAKYFEKSLKKLSRVNLAVFYVHLRSFLVPNSAASLPPQMEPLEGPTPDQFYARIGESLENVWQSLETRIAESHRDATMGVIHSVRIAAKRVRYLIEVIHEFDVAGTKETLQWLRGLQTHLGNWHDAEVLEQTMIAMVARPEFLHEHLPIAMGVEKLILRNRKGKESFKEKYFAMTRGSGDYERVNAWVATIVAAPGEAFRIDN